MELNLIETVSLVGLISTFQKRKMPLKTAYKFNKLMIELEPHHTFYEKKISEIIEEYGIRQENGEFELTEDKIGYKIQEGREEECNLEIQELTSLVVEIPNNIKFNLDELEDLVMDMQEMYLFNRFIEE